MREAQEMRKVDGFWSCPDCAPNIGSLRGAGAILPDDAGCPHAVEVFDTFHQKRVLESPQDPFAFVLFLGGVLVGLLFAYVGSL